MLCEMSVFSTSDELIPGQHGPHSKQTSMQVPQQEIQKHKKGPKGMTRKIVAQSQACQEGAASHPAKTAGEEGSVS